MGRGGTDGEGEGEGKVERKGGGNLRKVCTQKNTRTYEKKKKREKETKGRSRKID